MDNIKYGEESMDVYMEQINKLKEGLNEQFGIKNVELVMNAATIAGSVTEDDILKSIEFMNEKWESNRDIVSMYPIMNPESLMDIKLVPPPSLASLEFLPEPEEEPMPSEAWIKKQLKYEKNPMRIKQLNIMLNKKRKENKYGKGK